MSAAAIVTKVTGAAFAVRDGREISLAEGAELFVSDGVRTGLNGRADIRFADGTEVSLGEMSQVELRDFAFDPSAPQQNSFALHMMEGLVRTVSGEVVKLNPEGFSLSTPLGTAGIRGTTVAAQIFPTHVVFMVTDMAAGHVVIVNSVFGGELTIFQPGTGAEITLTGQEKIQLIETLPLEMREALSTLLSGEYEDGRSSHDDFLLLHGDAEFMASLGAFNLGRGVGLLDAKDAQIVIDLLQELGVEQDLYMEDGPLPGSEWPTVYWEGTPGADAYVGRMNQHHHLRSFEGNDTLVVFNGNDTIFGGNGSQDLIMKVASVMGAGTVIYGGEEELRNTSALDADTIILRGPADSDGPEEVNGQPNTAGYTSNAAEWTAMHMTGGAVYGSAGVLDNCVGVTTGNTITLIGDMSGGAIYGRGGSVSNSSFTGSNTISISAADVGGGNMRGGAIYGDGYSLNNVQAGGDSISVYDVMSGGTVYGDAYSLGSGSSAGNDTISIDVMDGGTVYGDARIADSSATGGDNTFGIATMRGGSIIGGTGDDLLDIGEYYGGSIDLGGGNDSIYISNGQFAALDIARVSGQLRIDTMGGSANAINVGVLGAGSTLTLGGGADRVITVADQQGGTIDLGVNASTHTLRMTAITGDSTVSAAAFTVGSLRADLEASYASGSSVTVQNAVQAEDAVHVTTGTGSDTLAFNAAVAGASIDLGAGDNSLSVTGALSSSTVSAGAGNDQLSLASAFNSTLNLGAGDNCLTVAATFSGGSVTTGAGDDSIHLGGAAGTVLVDAGTGSNTVSVTACTNTTLTISGNGNNQVTLGSLNNAVIDASASNTSTLSIGAVVGDATVTGVSGTSQVGITTMTSGELTLGGDYGYQYTAAISSFNGGALHGGEGADSFTISDNGFQYGMTGGSLAGGYGADTIRVFGAFANGVIAGDKISGDDSYAPYGADQIVLEYGMGGASGSPKIYGDAATVTLPNSVGDYAFGNDSIIVKGAVASGAIYGDAGVFSDASGLTNMPQVVFGNNSITLTQGFSAGSPGLAAGNASVMAGNASGSEALVIDDGASRQQGADKFWINSTVGPNGGGTVYGDAETLNLDIYQIGNSSFGDSISYDGSVQGGTAYGDAGLIKGLVLKGTANSLFADTITLNDAESSFTVYGDAKSIDRVVIGNGTDGGGNKLFADTVSGTLWKLDAGSAIYGDAQTIGEIRLESGSSTESFMADVITIRQGDRGTIYGDAQRIDSISVSQPGQCEDFMADSIILADSAHTVSIYGDAQHIDFVSYHAEQGDPLPANFMADHIELKGFFTDGAIYGDVQEPVRINWDMRLYDGSGQLIDYGSDKWHATFGCDSIYVHGMSGGIIDGGFGNDLIRVGGFNGPAQLMTGGRIFGGDGNDTIEAAGVNGGFIEGGDGNDSIFVTGLRTATLNGGEGDNTIEVSGAVGLGGNILSFSGNDSIDVSDNMTGANAPGGRITVNTGDGNDTVLAGADAQFTSFYLNDGDNSLNINQNLSDSAISAGGGNNSVFIGNNLLRASITLGDGNNSVSIGGSVWDSTFGLGNGNDAISLTKVGSAVVSLGEGSDTLFIGELTGGKTVKVSFGGGASGDGARDILALGDHAIAGGVTTIALSDVDMTGPALDLIRLDGANWTVGAWTNGSVSGGYTNVWHTTLTHGGGGSATLVLANYSGVEPPADFFWRPDAALADSYTLTLSNGYTDSITLSHNAGGLELLGAAGYSGNAANSLTLDFGYTGASASAMSDGQADRLTLKAFDNTGSLDSLDLHVKNIDSGLDHAWFDTIQHWYGGGTAGAYADFNNNWEWTGSAWKNVITTGETTLTIWADGYTDQFAPPQDFFRPENTEIRDFHSYNLNYSAEAVPMTLGNAGGAGAETLTVASMGGTTINANFGTLGVGAGAISDGKEDVLDLSGAAITGNCTINLSNFDLNTQTPDGTVSDVVYINDNWRHTASWETSNVAYSAYEVDTGNGLYTVTFVNAGSVTGDLNALITSSDIGVA